jgi:hypothetical protein
MKLNLGKFQDEQGNIVDSEPGPDDAFPIRCGRWPNEHTHAIQRLCAFCGETVGLSPIGLAYHEALPRLRPLCCEGCFEVLVKILGFK